MNDNIRLARLQNRRHFLIKCRRLGLVPNHITNGSKGLQTLLVGARGRVARKICEFQGGLGARVLNYEIQITYQDIRRIDSSVREVRRKLLEILPIHIVNEFEHRLMFAYNKVFNKTKTTNLRKLNALSGTFNFGKIAKNNDGWFVNLSDTTVPEIVKNFLSLGPKFGINADASSVSVPRLLADVESIITRTPIVNRDTIRSRCTNIITNYMLHSRRKNPIQSLLQTAHKTTVSFLKQERADPLLILSADKGQVTVAMNRSTSIQKSRQLFDDSSTYTILKKDPTSSHQKKNTLLRNF